MAIYSSFRARTLSPITRRTLLYIILLVSAFLLGFGVVIYGQDSGQSFGLAIAVVGVLGLAGLAIAAKIARIKASKKQGYVPSGLARRPGRFSYYHQAWFAQRAQMAVAQEDWQPPPPQYEAEERGLPRYEQPEPPEQTHVK